MHRIITLIIISSFISLSLFAKPKTLKEIELAFAKDGYEVVKKVEYQGQRGLHKTALNAVLPGFILLPMALTMNL